MDYPKVIKCHNEVEFQSMKSNVKQAQGQNMKRLGVRLEEEEKERKGRHLIIPIIFILVMSEYLLVRL